MIQPGNRVAVGVSGGKDSLLLLTAMARLREFYPALRWRPTPWTWGMWTGESGWTFPWPPSASSWRCPSPAPTEIHHIIFDLRREKNPCSSAPRCAGGRCTTLWRSGGSPRSPWATTLRRAEPSSRLPVLRGRLSCFQPVTYLDRTGITQIRPLLYCGEGMVRNARCPQRPAGGVQPLPGGRVHQAPGGQGADWGAGQALPPG